MSVVVLHDEGEGENVELHLSSPANQVRLKPKTPSPNITPPQRVTYKQKTPSPVVNNKSPVQAPAPKTPSPVYLDHYDDSLRDLANPNRTKERIETIHTKQRLPDPLPSIPEQAPSPEHIPQPPEAWGSPYRHPEDWETAYQNMPPVNPPDPEEEARKLKKHVDELLSKIDAAKKKGHDIPKNYNHTSNVDELESVVHRCDESDKRKAGLLISRKLLVGFVGVVEWLNHEYDPLGAKLDDWSSDVNANIVDFDDVLLRCWEKYGKSVSDANPLIELALALGLSGVMYHFTQSWMTSKSEEIDRELKNPAFQQNMNNMASSYQQQPPPPSPVRKRPPPSGPPPPTPIYTHPVQQPQGGNPLSGLMRMFGTMGGGGGMPSMPSMLPKNPPPLESSPPRSPPRSPPQSPPPIEEVEDDIQTISIPEETLETRNKKRKKKKGRSVNI